MSTITDQQITEYVEAHIGTFHDKRLEALTELRLSELLIKNPYLLRSKNLVVASDLVKSLLDAYLSSQEETMFGDFLEGLAIYVAEQVHNGQKSSTTGIDLEFTKDGARYLVSIKSGPNWGNSSQIAKMRDNFDAAARVIRQGNSTANVIAVNGCCYGRDSKPAKRGYLKYCGQDFWELISDDRDLFTRIIEPLGHNAKERNEDFVQRYGAVINRFTQEFIAQFCDSAGAVDWDKLVRYSSAATPILTFPADKRIVNQLRGIANVCDVLRQWGYDDLSNRVVALASCHEIDNRASSLNLGSLKGLMMLLGTVKSDAPINLTASAEGLITSEWLFADHRRAAIAFQDVDRVTVEATYANGDPIRIRQSRTGFSQRRTIVRILVEQGFFTMRPAE